MCKPHPSTASRGFTLIELVVSMSLVAVLLGGTASAIVLASRAIPADDDPLRAGLNAAYAAEQMADELLVAQSIVQRSPTLVEFTVADRDGDTAAETIRFEWSGTPGDPLTRQYNNGSLRSIAADVGELSLGFDTRIESTTTTSTVTSLSPEIDIASFDGWGGVTPSGFGVSPTWWVAEYFQITPPAEASTMNIVRVKLMMKMGTPDPGATVSVGIYKPLTPGEPIPQTTPIGTPAVVLTSSLSAGWTWTDFTFSDVAINTNETEYVIVVNGSKSGTASVQYYYWRSAPSDTHIRLVTTDSGASWDPRASAYDDYDIPFHVYGTYETTTTQEVTSDRHYIQAVDIALRLGADTSSRVETATRVLNAPEVTGP